MTEIELNNWWASLTQVQKCHIATKVYHDTITNGKEATRIWLLLDVEKKQWIHNHCTDSHGMIREDWQEGDSFSY